MFQQDWNNAVQSRERFELYASFKRVFSAEPYVDCCQLRCYKIAYVQFRLGISPVYPHRLRYRLGISPRQLLSPFCKTEIEDEPLIVFACTAYGWVLPNFPDYCITFLKSEEMFWRSMAVLAKCHVPLTFSCVFFCFLKVYYVCVESPPPPLSLSLPTPPLPLASSHNKSIIIVAKLV